MSIDYISQEKDQKKPCVKRAILTALFIYAMWFIATYFLEGRNLSLLRPEAVFERVVYIIIATFFIGTVASILVLRHFIASGVVTLDQLGFRSIRHTFIAVVISGLLGFSIFIVMNPPSLNPIVILNIFAQVLPVSLAEVVVCWAVIGANFGSLAQKRGRIVSLLAGILAADILFGFYHFAHSPPFNQVGMVLFLMIPGFLTCLVYFFGRNIYATIIFQNFFGVFGIMQALEKSDKLITYSQPLFPVLGMAFASLIILIGSDILLVRPLNLQLMAPDEKLRRESR